MAARDHFLEQFKRHKAALPGMQLPWLRNARTTAGWRFAELGLPTLRDEDWKYTRVSHLDTKPFDFIRPESIVSIVPVAAALEPFLLDGCHRLVFIDGRFASSLSQYETTAGDIVVDALANVLQTDPARCAQWLSDTKHPSIDDNGFVALAAAAWTDGAFIDLPAGARLQAPLQLLFVATVSDTALCTRNLIRLGEGAEAQIIEHHVGLGEGAYLHDVLSEVDLAPGAALAHIRLQEEGVRATHIGELRVEQAAGSGLTSASIALGARLSRTAIATRLAGEAARADLTGLYLADGRRHVDHHTTIDHAAPGGVSREHYKGILDGGGRAVFNGRVVVRPDAQRTDAAQTNHNLMLSANAEVDTKPQLEIWADDVKCSHGATVGQLDDDALYYLRSRGIDTAAARALLVDAFADEIVRTLAPPALQARVATLLHERLPGGENAI